MRPIQPGIMAVIVESNDERNVGAVVKVEFAYDGPLPADEDRLDGWWIVHPQVPIFSDVELEVHPALEAAEAETEGRALVHGSSLLPLLLGLTAGCVLRWDVGATLH